MKPYYGIFSLMAAEVYGYSVGRDEQGRFVAYTAMVETPDLGRYKWPDAVIHPVLLVETGLTGERHHSKLRRDIDHRRRKSHISSFVSDWTRGELNRAARLGLLVLCHTISSPETSPLFIPESVEDVEPTAVVG